MSQRDRMNPFVAHASTQDAAGRLQLDSKCMSLPYGPAPPANLTQYGPAAAQTYLDEDAKDRLDRVPSGFWDDFADLRDRSGISIDRSGGQHHDEFAADRIHLLHTSDASPPESWVQDHLGHCSPDERRAQLGPGTLHGALSTLQKRGWSRGSSRGTTSRKKTQYEIKHAGQKVLDEEIARMQEAPDNAHEVQKEVAEDAEVSSVFQQGQGLCLD